MKVHHGLASSIEIEYVEAIAIWGYAGCLDIHSRWKYKQERNEKETKLDSEAQSQSKNTKYN